MDRHVKADLQNASPEAEHIEIPIAARFQMQEHRDQQSHEHQRQGRGVRTGKRQRQGNACRNNGPVSRHIETLAPDCRSVSFRTVKVSDRSNFLGALNGFGGRSI